MMKLVGYILFIVVILYCFKIYTIDNVNGVGFLFDYIAVFVEDENYILDGFLKLAFVIFVWYTVVYWVLALGINFLIDHFNRKIDAQ